MKLFNVFYVKKNETKDKKCYTENEVIMLELLIDNKGQHMISYCQRPPISLKILLNISSLISAQFCNEMCAYE